jgi:hypothetical protein
MNYIVTYGVLCTRSSGLKKQPDSLRRIGPGSWARSAACTYYIILLRIAHTLCYVRIYSVQSLVTSRYYVVSVVSVVSVASVASV